jgi:NAD-dependent DNA ligase
MNELLPAFSIPLIGKTAAEKLSTKINNISELNADKCKAAGLGPKATENLLNWYFDEFLSDLVRLPFEFSFTKSEQQVSKGVVCISGKLKSFKTKAQAQEVLAKNGYEVKSSITKDVTILVNESGIESAKTKTAQDKGITIVTNLLDFLGEEKNGNIA